MQTHAGCIVLALGLGCGMPATAAQIAAGAQTLAATVAAGARMPAAREFVVASAGQVEVQLRDLGIPGGGVEGFDELHAVITRGGSKIDSLSASPGTTQTRQFTATSATYQIQVIGKAKAPGGTFDVVVRTVPGNDTLLQFPGEILAAAPPPSPAASNLDLPFDVTQAGSYQVTLTDRAFPAALALLDPVLIGPGAGLPPGSSSCVNSTCTINFTATGSGSYQLFVPATAGGTDQAGLYSLAVTGPGGITIHASTERVGTLPAPMVVNLPAGGGLTLGLADFATPVALASLRAMVIQGAASLGTRSGTGSATLTVANAGAAEVHVFSRAGAGGKGSYEVSITQASTSLLHAMRTVPKGFDATLNSGGYSYSFQVPAAGDFIARLRDQAFPLSFGSLTGTLVQNGNVVAPTITSVGTNASLAAGDAFVLVFGNPPVSGNSLFGLTVAPMSGGPALLDSTQGVGPLIGTREVDIPAAGSYDLTVGDLEFPQAFQELDVALTKGVDLVARAIGGGKLTFTGSAGKHFINVLGRPAAAPEYGTWGFTLATTPPAPAITLSASPLAVASGSDATLNWSVTGATSCTASDGWSGSRATSGSASTGALVTAATFVLSCNGPGGDADSSVTVSIAVAQSGGGGAVDLLLLAALAAMLGGLVVARIRRT